MIKEFEVNGFKVVHHRVPNKVISIRVVVNAGSNQDGGVYGLAHFLEHMHFKGTRNYTYKEINLMSSSLGAINAYTDYNKTVYRINTTEDKFEKAAALLFEIAFKPRFIKEEFDKEKKVIIEEIQTSLDNAWYNFYYQTIQNFRGEKIGHPIAGTIESVEKTTVENLLTYVRRHYVKENMVISIVGDIAFFQVKQAVQRLLNGLDIGWARQTEGGMEIIDGFKREGSDSKIERTANLKDYHFQHSSKQAIIGILAEGLSSVEARNNNFVQDVFTELLAGGMHSLLFNRIREELGLCYDIRAFTADTGKENSIIMLKCLLDRKNIGKAVEEIGKIIGNIKGGDFDNGILNVSKERFIYDLTEEADSSEEYGKLFTDSYFDYEKRPIGYDEAVKRIRKITKNDVIRYANKYFTADKLKYCQMTQKKEGIINE